MIYEPFFFDWWLIQIWVFLATLAFTFLVHEYGHYKALKQYGRNPKVWYKDGDFNVGVPKDYELLTKEEQKNVYWAGIYAGLFPLSVPMFFLLFPPLSIGLMVVYLAGCKHDFKQIARLSK